MSKAHDVVKLIEAVEALIDGSDVAAVLSALEIVCREKADHLRSAWQDEEAARSYLRDARRIGRVKIEN